MSKKAILAAAIAATLAGVSSNVLAVDNVWTGATSTDWNDPTNWSLGRVPTNANGATTGDTFDDAVVNSTSGFPIIVADFAATPRDIVVGSGTGNAGQVNHTAGTAATGGGNWFFVGRDGATGTYNLADTTSTGGTLTHFGTGSGNINVGGRVYVGGTEFGATGAVGTLNMNTTGTLNVSNDLAIGTDGSTGTINLDAGTITTHGWNFIGKGQNQPGGNGTLNMSGGTITNGGGRTYVGYGNSAANNSTGSFVMTGGTYNNIGDYFSVGDNNLTSTAAVPSVTLSGGTLNSSLFVVGGNPDRGGNGMVTVNGASALLNTAGELWVGQGAGSTGVMNVSAGTVTTGNWVAVGRQGSTGTLTVNGTGQLVKQGGGDITIGTGANGHGTVNVSGGGLLSSNEDIIVSENDPASVGVVNQSGGTVNVARNLEIQRNGSGTYNMSAGILSINGSLLNSNGGTFNFTGGTVTRSNPGVINVVGNLTIANKAAGLTLDADKTFAVSGALDITQGITLDVTGLTIPANTTATGSYALGTVGSQVGTFDPSTTTLLGLSNPGGATFISETAGEGHTYSNSQSVYWIQDSAGAVSLQYSVAPEPGTLGLLAVGGLGLLARRRRAAV